MKRLLTIVLITAILGLLAWGFVWVQNERTLQDVSDIDPIHVPTKTATGTTKTGTVASGVVVESNSGATLSGSVTTSGTTVMMTGAVVTGAN